MKRHIIMHFLLFWYWCHFALNVNIHYMPSSITYQAIITSDVMFMTWSSLFNGFWKVKGCRMLKNIFIQTCLFKFMQIYLEQLSSEAVNVALFWQAICYLRIMSKNTLLIILMWVMCVKTHYSLLFCLSGQNCKPKISQAYSDRTLFYRDEL